MFLEKSAASKEPGLVNTASRLFDVTYRVNAGVINTVGQKVQDITDKKNWVRKIISILLILDCIKFPPISRKSEIFIFDCLLIFRKTFTILEFNPILQARFELGNLSFTKKLSKNGNVILPLMSQMRDWTSNKTNSYLKLTEKSSILDEQQY